MPTLAKLIIVIHLFDFIYCSLSSRECNQEAFKLWHQKAYESSADNHIDLIHAEALRIKRKDKKLWNVFNLDHNPLSSNFTNGQVMELSAHVCKNLIKGRINVKSDIDGLFGNASSSNSEDDDVNKEEYPNL